MTDMAGAWLAAGARAVLVAQADLTYAQAEQATLVLHRELARPDQNLAAALQTIRRQLSQDHGPAAPYQGLLQAIGLAHFPLHHASESEAGRSPDGSLALPAAVWLLLAFAAGAILAARLR
jgi:hypothetical protein